MTVRILRGAATIGFVALVCSGARLARGSEFQAAIPYPAGSSPVAIAAGDFNGDGLKDLAVVNVNGDNVSILLGNGDGSFQAPVNYGAGSGPNAIVAADFNRDGRLDLAVSDVTGGASAGVSVLLGNGDGTFSAAVSYKAGQTPLAVAAGDFNGDGKPDLVVANHDSNNVAILLGHGDGTFSGPTYFYAGKGPAGVAVGDVNHDGKADLAVTDDVGYTVSVLLGTGTGAFGSATSYATGLSPAAVVMADFNGDHRLDLATANLDDTISVLLGKGDGTFNNAASVVTAGSGTFGLITGDLNGDGKADLIVVSYFSDSVGVLLGKGNGAFQPAVSYLGGFRCQAAAAADFNRDGALDLVTADFGADTATVMLGNGDGTLRAARGYTVGNGDFTKDASPQQVVWGDFNRDGKVDLVTSNGGVRNNISIYLGNGDGTLQHNVDFQPAFPSGALVVGDFNGDGLLDLGMGGGSADRGYVTVIFGNGDGTFHNGGSYPAGGGLADIAAGDFDGNGTLDLAAVQAYGGPHLVGAVNVLFNLGDGSFRGPVTYDAGADPIDVTVADLNGDGRPDIVTANNGFLGPSSVSVLLNAGNGFFLPAVNYTAGSQPLAVTTGDFNRDGFPDIAVANMQGNQISVLLNAGDGTFGAAQDYVSGFNPDSVVTADFNGDHRLDLAVANLLGDDVSVLPGDGTGKLLQAANYQGGATPQSLIAPDLNGDGAPDLVTTDGYVYLVVLLNTGGTRLTLTSMPNPSQVGQQVTFTATVAASVKGAGTPTGTVTFKDGSTTLGTVPLSAGTAQLVTSSLSAGMHSITAVYSGNANFNPNASAPLVQTVNP